MMPRVAHDPSRYSMWEGVMTARRWTPGDEGGLEGGKGILVVRGHA